MGGPSRSGRAGVTGGEDDAVVRALYQTYRAPLMAFVLRLTGGDRQHAEDVVQETMVRAWREAGRLDLTGPSLMPWLTSVARRIVIDEHRRKRARPAETGEDTVADTAVDDDTAATVLRVAVADAMRQLTSSHRQILNETILRDQTVNQAAETLGIPVGTAKSRVYYALRVLEVVLAERGLVPLTPAQAQPGTIEVPSTLMATAASGVVAGPWTTEPSLMLNLLPWHGQSMVPSLIWLTRQPWCVHTALNALNDPARGCVITMFSPLMILPPPSGTSAVVASAAEADAPPLAALLAAAPEAGGAVPAPGVAALLELGGGPSSPPLLASCVLQPASAAAHVTPAPISSARRL